MELSSLEQEWFQVNEEAKLCFEQVEEVEAKLERVAGGAITQLKGIIQKIKDEISSSESKIIQCQCTIDNMPKKKEELERTKHEVHSLQQSTGSQISQRKKELAIKEDKISSLKANRAELRVDYEEVNSKRKEINDQVQNSYHPVIISCYRLLPSRKPLMTIQKKKRR